MKILAVMRVEFYVRITSTDTHSGQAIWCLDLFIAPGYNSTTLFRSGVLLSYFLDLVFLLVLVGAHVWLFLGAPYQPSNTGLYTFMQHAQPLQVSAVTPQGVSVFKSTREVPKGLLNRAKICSNLRSCL